MEIQDKPSAQNLQSDFSNLVCHIFSRETSAFIFLLGRRETGKTDLSLLMAQILHANKIIENISTNIKIHSSPIPISHCTNLQDLQFWARNTQGKKLFIFDEAGKSLRRRTPLSRLNVKLLDQLQVLRKYKLSIVAIAPDEKYVDSATFGTDVLDGIIIKHVFGNPKIALYKDFLEDKQLTLTDLPRTTIQFDTWDVAPFTEASPDSIPKFKGEDRTILWKWSHGMKCHQLGLHQQKLNRLVVKFVKEVLEREQVTSRPLESGDNNPQVEVTKPQN